MKTKLERFSVNSDGNSLLDEIGELSEEEAAWPCGENHRVGEFCFCGQSEYLQ